MIKKTALVTGSRRGIGLGIARALAGEGYHVILSATRPAADCEDLVQSFLDAGQSAEYLPCDISIPAQRQAVIDEILRRHGRLDLLVNNAGVAPAVRRDLLEMTEDSFDRVLDVNLKGTFFLCQLAANRMLALLDAGLADYRPRIVNIGSISAYTASVNRGEYCISKAGVSMVTKLFADRLAPYGIPVFEVRPGIIRTDMTAGVEEKYKRMIEEEGVTPIRRFGQPEDVAACVLAAAGGLLDFATGQVLNADGGFHIRRL